MTAARSNTHDVAWAAMLCAGAMVAQQVATKAARDAFFLSSYPVSALPSMLVVSAVASIAFVIPASRMMRRFGPGRSLPVCFAASGALLLGCFWLAAAAPRAASVALYLHVATFGSLLISGFWLLVSEHFDPRTAKRHLGRLAGAGTAGGLLGGVAAERIAAWAGAVALIPFLTGLHLFCAWKIRAFRPTSGGETEPEPAAIREPAAAPLKQLVADGYLRSIATFVLVGSIGGALSDYLFKVQAVARFSSADALLRFFSIFYTATGVLALIVQVGLGRAALERIGLTGTAAALPLALAGGGIGCLLAPGLVGMGGLRAAESVLRGSLYRLGYELLYTPLPASQKRPVKGLVDVAIDRAGDAVGGLVIRAVLWAAPAGAITVLSGLVVALGVLGLYAAGRLRRGYVLALEKGLLSHALELGASDVLDSTTRKAVHQTLGPQPLPATSRRAVGVPQLGAVDALDTGLFLFTMASDPTEGPGSPQRAREAARPVARDPLAARLAELRSGDRRRVRLALAEGPVLDPLLVPCVIRLTAWDDVADVAIRALQSIAPRIVGQVADALADPDEEFSIRRRLPRVLSEAAGPPAVAALLGGLHDQRFEVRLECGRALVQARQRKVSLAIDESAVFAAILRETAADRALWESRSRSTVGSQDSPLVDELLRGHVDLSLEHVFTLLSLVLPREPVRVAFRALHTDDAALRGTALEYIESVVPPEVRARLMPILEPAEAPPRPSRKSDAIVAELLRSDVSIRVRLAALRGEPPR